jgi:acetyl esterase
LRGLPDALVITAESDILRDEGEAYARKLCEANVRVTCSRYLGTIHDFVMLNAIADTPAARGAIAQAIHALRGTLD